MTLKKLKRRYFDKHSMGVTGERGAGKDMLMGNIAVRSIGYVSNMDYGGNYEKLDFDKISMNGNTYENLINGNVKYYKYPYQEGHDIYISDAGAYFPSQHFGALNARFKGIPLFNALCRHLGNVEVHVNVQNLERCYDKFREHLRYIIDAQWCKVLFKGRIVIQKIRVYGKAQSCIDHVKPCRIRIPWLASKQVKLTSKMHVDQFENSYGTIQDYLLVYVNKTKYDTRYFKKLFEEGERQSV